MSKSVTRTVGAQVPDLTQVVGSETVQSEPVLDLWSPPSNELFLIHTVVHYPRVIPLLRDSIPPLHESHFSDKICGCVYIACRSLFSSKKRITLASIDAELQEWEFNPVYDASISRLARQHLPKLLAGNIETIPNELAAKKRVQEWADEIRALFEKTYADKSQEEEFQFTTDLDLDSRLTGIEWLWNGYIPRGFVTAIVGDQEQGKSTVAQNLCDIILRGNRWPDGQPWMPRADTRLVWVDTEGSISLFHDRLRNWGMPRGRFIFPPDPLQETQIDNPQHWRQLERAIEHFSPPLVVFDSLSGSHGARENANDEMKVIMKRLSDLAQRYNIAVMVIHHLSKPVAGVPDFPITLHRLRGASSISQFCRSILALGTPDKSQPLVRRLDVIKLNLAKKPEPVGYALGNLGPEWGEAIEPPKERRAVDDAKDFLEIALKDGPRPSDELQAEAKAQGIGGNAINDAKKALGIKPVREGGKDGRWFLALRDYKPTAAG